MYFVVTSMAGIRHMGIWFFWIRVGKKASLQWNLEKNGNTLLTEHEMFCLFSFSAVQNKTKENPSPGPSLPVYDPPADCASYQLYDLQPCPAICHVRKPEVSGAGEEMFS